MKGVLLIKSSTALFKYIPCIFLSSKWGRKKRCHDCSLRVVRNLLTITINPEKGEKVEGVSKFPNVLPENSGYLIKS